MSAEANPPGGLESHSGGSSYDQNPDSPKQTKSKSGPAFLGLTRCAACYNHKARLRRDSDGESSSSAEDSGPEVDWESDAESSSSSSSCSSSKAPSEIPRPPEPVETAEPESGGKGSEGQEQAEGTLEGLEDISAKKRLIRRAPLVKSYSLPSSFPHLVPFSLLPRPPTVVSTLHLQVLSRNHKDEPFSIVQQHLYDPAKTEKVCGERRGISNPPYPQVSLMHQNRLQWQQRSLPSLQQPQLPYPHQRPTLELSYQLQQQQQPQHTDRLSAQGQMLPPTTHTLPVLRPQPLCLAPQIPNAPLTHVHAHPPQPCWHCYSMQYPYTHQSHNRY